MRVGRIVVGRKIEERWGGEKRMNEEWERKGRWVEVERVGEEELDSLSPRDCRPMSDILNRFVVWGLSGKS